MKQVIGTTQKINSLELLLKQLLKPIHQSTSEVPLIKELTSTIHNTQQNQFNYFIENKIQLRKIFTNTKSAYRATLDNSYLDIITEIKKVLTNANLAYEATQLPSQLPGPNQTSKNHQNFLKYSSDCLTHEFQHIQPQTNISKQNKYRTDKQTNSSINFRSISS